MITKICICGAGTMGSGIAMVCARAGFNTLQYDVDAQSLAKSRKLIQAELQQQVDKGKMDEVTKEEVISRIQFTTNVNDCTADVIIEAIVEKHEPKTALFVQLAALNSREAVLATNTSSIPVSEIALHIPEPSRVIGMHFFNPAPVMKLVEVVKGDQTSDSVLALVCSLCEQLGKTPVICKDAPGFIVNRVARNYYLEAMRLVEQGIVSIEQVDRIMEASGFRMGPFRLMDLIGMDINLSVSTLVWSALGNPARLEPSVMQQQKVKEGNLGKKTGKGFYDY